MRIKFQAAYICIFISSCHMSEKNTHDMILPPLLTIKDFQLKIWNLEPTSSNTIRIMMFENGFIFIQFLHLPPSSIYHPNSSLSKFRYCRWKGNPWTELDAGGNKQTDEFPTDDGTLWKLVLDILHNGYDWLSEPQRSAWLLRMWSIKLSHNVMSLLFLGRYKLNTMTKSMMTSYGDQYTHTYIETGNYFSYIE
jgi:hypothetical protein